MTDPLPSKYKLSEGEYFDALAAVVGRKAGNPVSMNHEQWEAFWKLANAAKSITLPPRLLDNGKKE